jgi:hypothetical protein
MNGSSCTNGCCGDFHFTRIHPWAPLFLSVALHITIRHVLCDEVGTLDWAIALQQLLDLINEIATKAGKKLSALIQRQLQQWIAALPNYIKACLPISYCES